MENTDTDNIRLLNNKRVNEFYTKKIHTNTEFYEKEKKRVAEYQREKYKNDPEYREKRKEYCRLKMKERYQKKKLEKEQVAI
jgi:hypothetical protein